MGTLYETLLPADAMTKLYAAVELLASLNPRDLPYWKFKNDGRRGDATHRERESQCSILFVIEFLAART